MASHFIYLMICFTIFNFVEAGHHQRRLLDKLFKNYDPLERPVANDSDSLNVTIGLAIQQIVDVDEKKQTLVFSGWLDMAWTDYNLQWNPEEYGNITTLRISSSKIWVPDLLLYNSADDTFDVISKVNAVLYYTGEVTFLPPGMFKSTCPIKIDDFPFDEQNCSLKFGSWTYDEASLNLKNKSDRAQLDSYIKNGEWYLEDVNSYSESITYECCPQKFPFVMFVIQIRRRTLYFLFNLIFPCVLISFMSLLGFSLPPESGEKMGLEITVLLSIIMFSQIITSIIPESSLSIPKIALYFAFVMAISSLSIIANVVVLIFHHRNVKIQRPMPRWVEILICHYLAKILNMKRPSKDGQQQDDSANLKKKSAKKTMMLHGGGALSDDLNELSSKSLLANVLDINDDFLGNKFSLKNSLHKRAQQNKFTKNSDLFSAAANNQAFLKRENSNVSQSGALESNDAGLFSSSTSKTDIGCVKRNLACILKEVKAITQKIRDDEEDESKELSWKFAAMVIDRLCMVIFAALTIIITVSILMTSKNFFMSSDPHPVY